jgi:hypothetical protein
LTPQGTDAVEPSAREVDLAEGTVKQVPALRTLRDLVRPPGYHDGDRAQPA